MSAPHVVEATPAQARELTERIKFALDGTWQLIETAYVSRAWAALGYRTWDEYCTREFGTHRLRLPREERQEVVASLREIGMSVRAIAAATGTSIGVVHRSLTSGVPGGTPEVRTPEWDAALRDNDTDPDQLSDDEYVALTQPTSGDHGVVPNPRTVTGIDGKAYPVTPTRTPARQALPPQFQTVATALTQVIHRIEKLRADDRFRTNRAAVGALCLPEVRRAAEVLAGLLSDLGHEDGDPR